MLVVVGRSGASMDYYYSGEMRSDHTVSSGLIYDGEMDQRRDNRRRSVTVEHVDNVTSSILSKKHIFIINCSIC